LGVLTRSPEKGSPLFHKLLIISTYFLKGLRKIKKGVMEFEKSIGNNMASSLNIQSGIEHPATSIK
jgi:hypothetical protein